MIRSSGGITSTATSSMWRPSRRSAIGSAASFDGKDDYVRADGVCHEFAAKGGYTIGGWVYPTNATASGNVVWG